MSKTTIPILILFVAVCLSSCSARGEGDFKDVCFDSGCIKVEVVQTPEDRGRGLQNRQSMGKDEGMLFIFPRAQHQSFWMKDTLIPLDMIWIDHHKKIVFIIHNALPCVTEQCPVYTPDAAANYVLEVNAGVSLEMGLRVGDQTRF
jgi:uncharacterized membrane protein (UPF0127 family)